MATHKEKQKTGGEIVSNDNKTFTFKQEDIFEDIPGDDKNVMFTIPPEIMELQGWKEGDNLKISWGDQGTVIIEKIDEIPDTKTD